MKFTVAPGTNPFPEMVIGIELPSGLSAVTGAEAVEMEVTDGTMGFHCQLSWVML